MGTSLVSKMKKSLEATKKGEEGFSLIELMVVVAIIGILSAIAIPNFQRFQAKSRQSEARGNLSGYYSAARASFAENGYYPGNFVAVGFQPDGDLNYRITVADGTDPLNPPNRDTCITTVAGTDCTGMTVSWNEVNPDATGGTTTGPQNPATARVTNNTQFTAIASGRIGLGTNDEWSITQVKTLRNVVPGIP